VIVGALGLTLTDPRRHSLEVLTTVLSGQSGRLFTDLRDAQSLAYALSSTNVEGIDPGHVLIHMGTSPDKLPRALAGLYGHIERLRTEPPTEAELGRAKRYLIGTHAIHLQHNGARGMLMALNERYGLGYDEHTHYAERVRAVRAEDVSTLAAELLAPQRLVEVVVGPAEP
jgi:zinc protease